MKFQSRTMAPTSYSSSTKSHWKSISLPSRPHSTILRIEDELNKLNSWEASSRNTIPSSGSVVSGLSMLEEVYVLLEEFIVKGSTREVVSRTNDHSAIDEILDVSISVLAACEVVRDIVGQVKEHARALMSALRRRKPNIESQIAEYSVFRKRVKKDAKRLVKTLKLVDNKLMASILPLTMLDQDPDFSRAVWVLQEVNLSSISVFRSLVFFLSGPKCLKPKQGGWRGISRLLVHKGVVGCEKREDANELECVDESLRSVLLCKKGGEKVDMILTKQLMSKQLGDLEDCVVSIEEGLESLFRRLIRSRVSLLNIISQ